MANQPDMLGMPDGEAALSLVGRDLSVVPDGKWPGLLCDILRVLENLYRRRGHDPKACFALAADSAIAIGEFIGGRQIYLPRGVDLRNAVRDAEIYRRAKSGNIEALAKEFGLADGSIYRILREQRALHMSKIQGCLPFDQE